MKYLVNDYNAHLILKQLLIVDFHHDQYEQQLCLQ